jgi:hypothetical protein
MKDMKKTKDKRFVLVEALLRYADQSGSSNPHFYLDEMLRMLDVCEHVFNIMQKQLGDRYCHRVDGFEERSKYAINVNRCLELRDQIIQASTKERRHREGIRNILLATSIGTFLVILVGCCII